MRSDPLVRPVMHPDPVPTATPPTNSPVALIDPAPCGPPAGEPTVIPVPPSTIEDATNGDVPAPFGTAFAVNVVRFEGPDMASVRLAERSPPPVNGEVVPIFSVLAGGVNPRLAVAAPVASFAPVIVAFPTSVGSIVPPTLVRTIVEAPVVPNGTLDVKVVALPATPSWPLVRPVIPADPVPTATPPTKRP